jgi:hypothetical protein
LQIIATTHALTIIKEVSIIQDLSRAPIDSVIYLINSKNPVLLGCSSYPKIKNDMLLNPVLSVADKLPNIKIYFEDEEAIYFFNALLKSRDINVSDDFEVEFEIIRSKLGCESLLQLSQADSYFKTVMVIFDNDVVSSAKSREVIQENSNFIVLPATESLEENCPSTHRSPEAIIFNQLLHMSKNYEVFGDTFWQQSINQAGFGQDNVDDNILKLFIDGNYNREVNKKLFNDYKTYLDKVDVIKYWAEQNPAAVDKFIAELQSAVDFLLIAQFGKYK